LCAAGERVDAVRRSAAPEFVEALAAAVSDLAMSGSRFEVSFGDLPFEAWTNDGTHKVEFLYAPAPGQPARPLARIASGGELSRVMLALKGVLGEADTVRTLVFDEVDAGIGGATAHTVGSRLRALSRTHQVIVVTHLAQVAAYADRQLVVEKSVTDDAATTTVRTVDGVERESEIARMLSGNDSTTSIAHARELLAEATTTR
jgi:DNA repair protein RecN (Recombination protein N)